MTKSVKSAGSREIAIVVADVTAAVDATVAVEMEDVVETAAVTADEMEEEGETEDANSLRICNSFPFYINYLSRREAGMHLLPFLLYIPSRKT